MTARNRAFRIGLLSPVLLFLSVLPLTSSFPQPRSLDAGGDTTPTVATPAHPAERHSRVGVAALVLPNIRGNKAQALARIEALRSPRGLAGGQKSWSHPKRASMAISAISPV